MFRLILNTKFVKQILENEFQRKSSYPGHEERSTVNFIMQKGPEIILFFVIFFVLVWLYLI